MRLEIVNEDLGIAVLNNVNDFGEYKEKIQKEYGSDVDFTKITVLFLKEKNLIVINKSHPLFEYYFDIIQAYLVLSAESRQVAVRRAPSDTIRCLLAELDITINEREMALLHG